MKYLYLIVYIFILDELCAQLPKIPYQQIEFENIIPNWYLTSGDAVFVSPYYDEYNKLSRYFFQKIEIEDKYFYNLFKVHGRDQEGAYIEKVDLLTGEIEWFNFYDLTTSDRQEVPVLMRIKSGEYVEIVSQRLNVPFSTENDLYFSGTNMSVVYRKYNDVSGALMEELIPDENDTLSLKTQHESFVRGNYVSYFISEVDGNFRYIERVRFNNKFKFRSYKLDKHGYVLSKTDTIDLGVDLFNAAMLKAGEDTLVYLYYNPIDKQAYLQFYDFELNKIDEKALEGFNTNYSILMREANEGHVLVQYSISTNNPLPLDTVVVSAYDYQGKLLGQMRIQDELNVSWAFQYIDKDDEFIILESRYIEESFIKREVRVFKTEEGNKILKKSIRGLDSLRTFSPYSFRLTENNIIMSIGEGAFFINDKGKYEQDIFAQAFSTISIPLSELGLATSSKDEVEQSPILVYPNPASSCIHFEWQEVMEGGKWEIYDLSGKKVKSGILNKEVGRQLVDIIDLVPGLYLISLVNDIGTKSQTIRFYKQ